MGYLLDTNIVIHARDGHDGVLDQLSRHGGAVTISALCVAELQRGLLGDPAQAALRRERLALLMANLPVLPFDRAAAEAYGSLIASLGWARGRDFDRMIAAHAISTRSVLVTENSADFRDIPGLVIENWTT